NSSLDLSEVLDYILASMWRVVPHDVAEIMLIDEASLSIVRSRGHSKFNIHDSAIALSDSNMDTPVLRQMREVRHYVLYPDTSNIPFAAPIMSQDSLRSYIGVPLFWQQELIGFLNLASQDVGFFNDQHAERLAGFATQCAIAIRNAQLYQKAQAVAVLEERQRLARDLHDAVSQMLFTSNLIAETLPRLQESDPEKFQENLQKLRFLNRGALAEMRTLLLELRPAKLESTDMYHLLEQFAHAAEGQTRMTIQLEVHEQTRLPPEVHLTFYRVAQEALNNIIKHAKADFVKIIYHAQNHSAFLKIEDDGIGFTVDRASSKSLGLGIMQERMEKIGGGLEVDSEAGAGTIILATWNQPPPE
ncbi:MAG TPA: GAF domain-containing sensor histidine kinase, partial [Aggregatilineales bacterium]|nr:GAF domain-containing sensor histidine kinase [Aggregatilineales bacterium]